MQQEAKVVVVVVLLPVCGCIHKKIAQQKGTKIRRIGLGPFTFRSSFLLLLVVLRVTRHREGATKGTLEREAWRESSPSDKIQATSHHVVVGRQYLCLSFLQNISHLQRGKMPYGKTLKYIYFCIPFSSFLLCVY